MIPLLKKIAKSTSFVFVLTKYLTYGLQFINALLIAEFLGVFYFGVYGFFRMMAQYFSYTNLGVNYSFNVIVSCKKKVEDKVIDKYYLNAVIITILFGGITALLTYFNFRFEIIDLGKKYNFSNYYILFIAFFILKQVNVISLNLLRLKNKYRLINLYYFIPVFLELLVILVFKDYDDFILYLLYGMVIAQAALVAYFYVFVYRVSFSNFSFEVFEEVLKRGVKLLVYNISFYLIFLISRSLVSAYGKVEDFSQYNLAYNISEAIMMLTGAISFLVYPKILNKVSNSNKEKVFAIINEVKSLYSFATGLFIMLCLLVLPVVYEFLPSYKASQLYLIFFLLFQLNIANIFAYTFYLLERKEELFMSFIGFGSVLIIVGGFYLLDNLFDYPVVLKILVSLFFGVWFYCFSLTQKTLKLISDNNSLVELLGEFLNLRIMGPLYVYTYFVMMGYSPFLIGGPMLLIFLYLNRKILKYFMVNVNKVLFDNNSLKI